MVIKSSSGGESTGGGRWTSKSTGVVPARTVTLDNASFSYLAVTQTYIREHGSWTSDGLAHLVLEAMVQTSNTDDFLKLEPFRSPLTDLLDFGMAGKLLTSATRRCSRFVDSVSHIWTKVKKWLIIFWGPTVAAFWPISAVASTTNGRPQRSQPPFRSAFLGQFSLP